MDVNRALRTAVQTGKVLIGTKETLRSLNDGKARLIVLADNTPDAWKARIEQRARERGVPLYRFGGSNGELGPACGKPFGVAALSVLEAGESDILALARQA
ncbi:MAG TPA: 50S ribosomal protein L30e [Candidatus Thermoplasmatota archaeon]|jgi:large subunit ribosomal protein L30e|nr:50S ribosomal protein L30e [Candidatus Thermoplasmatota archaeon]